MIATLKVKDKLRKWLEVPEPPSEPIDWSPAFKKQEARINEFEDQLKKFIEVECANCGKHFFTYPYGGGYYTSHDGRRFHSGKCLDEFIAKKKGENDGKS